MFPWPSAVLRSVALVALVCPVAASVQADFRESYSRGIRALDQERWEEAIGQFRAAIAAQPKEDSRRTPIYGNRSEPYLPHYYLGLSYFRVGQCAEALRAWRQSESQGVVARERVYDSLKQNRPICEQRLLPGVNKAAAAAEAEIQSAADKAEQLKGLAGSAELSPIWSREANLGPAEGQALKQLASARSLLEQGRKAFDVAQVDEARDAARRAGSALDDARRAAESRRGEILKAQAETKKPDPPPANADERKPLDVPGPEKPAEKLPPDGLRAAVRLYAEGRYEAARAVLKSAGYDSGPVAAQSRLFEAAAAFALYVRGGQREAALLTEAQEAVRQGRRLDPALSPDPEWFSPRFIRFFGSVR